MSDVKPRTWTLHCPMIAYPNVIAAGLGMNEEVVVLEADPVLDLLERHLPADRKPRCAVDRETVALLREHGRLS